MRHVDADALIAEYDRVHVGKPGRARELMVNAPTIEPAKAIENLVKALVETGSEMVCDTMPDDGWCTENCRYAKPQEECWIRWAETQR